jgi:hypothetical protein
VLPLEARKAADREAYLTELRALPGQWGVKIREPDIHPGGWLSVNEVVAWCSRPRARASWA